MTDPQPLQATACVKPRRTLARRMCELTLPTALIFIIMVELPMAQTRTVASVSADPIAAAPSRQQIGLLVGRSTVITTARPIQRVALSTADVADALVTSSHELLVHGKSPGTISLLLWSDTGDITNYDVVVRRDLSDLQTHLTQLFPGEDVSVAANGTDVVLAGTVSSKYVVEKASAVAVGYVENADNVVNLLRQQEQEGVGSEQIMLRVRFAEVSRTAVQELGVSFFTDMFGSNGQVGRITTQQFAAPDFNGPNSQQFGAGSDGLVFSDFLNIVAFNNKESLGVVIRALETRGLFQSLAEPNLITQDGTEATFLAGGEYPYPILQGVSGAVTILFKEFGIRLAFTPTITAQGRIHLKVAPEVSALDFSNSITIDGFRVPALSTRRTETQVELRDGQTFAVAGLLDNSVTETMSKIPGLGDIPILGKLFTSRAYQKSQSELVVMITPHIVRSGSAGVAAELPDLAQPFLTPSEGSHPPPDPVPLPEGGAVQTVPTSSVAQLTPDPVQPPPGGALPEVVEPVAPAVIDATTAAAPLAGQVQAERLQAEAARAREEEQRAADAEQARLQRERARAEQTREADPRSAREHERLAREAQAVAIEEAVRVGKAAKKQREEEQKQAREDAKLAAEQAKRAAKAEQARLKVEQAQAEQARRAEEQLAREQEKLAREQQKRAIEEAARVAKAAEKQRKADEEEAKRARKLEEKEAIEWATAEAKRYAQEQKLAEKVAKERAKRQAELDKIRAEYQARLDDAQRAVEEVDVNDGDQ